MDYFIGVDVQTARGCPFAILDEDGTAVEDGWVEVTDPDSVVAGLKQVLDRHNAANNNLSLAVDAPRVPLPEPRQWYWRGRRWRRCEPKDQGAGRHCEVVVAAHRLANPQWTPSRPPFPAWMELGFAIFEQLGAQYAAYEVFPSASYHMLQGENDTTVTIRLGSFAPGAKDMLDAYVAAATLREFVQGRGCEIGGGDGLGSIVLPRPLRSPIADVLEWPGQQPAAPFGR